MYTSRLSLLIASALILPAGLSPSTAAAEVDTATLQSIVLISIEVPFFIAGLVVGARNAVAGFDGSRPASGWLTSGYFLSGLNLVGGAVLLALAANAGSDGDALRIAAIPAF